MNSSVRKYVNKLGMFYKRYLPDGNLFGVRMFGIVDEYYFNDKLVDISYAVGLNVGKFKSQISSRAQIEITLYIKDTLKIVDHIVSLIQGKNEYFEYSKKSEYRVNYNDVVMDVEAIFAIKRISNDEFRLGVVYRSQTGEIIDSMVVSLDYYDLVELHNLFKSFTQTSYNFIINLATHEYFKSESINYKTTERSEVIDKGISSVVVNAEPISDDVIKSFEEESTLELNLPIKNLNITIDENKNNIEDEKTIENDSSNTISTEENNTDINDNRVETTETKTESDVDDTPPFDVEEDTEDTQQESSILDDMKSIMLGDDEDITEENNTISNQSNDIDNIDNNTSNSNTTKDINPGLLEFLESIKQFGCSYSFRDGVPILEEITDDVRNSFYSLLSNYIKNINEFGLSSVQLKPGFKLMLLSLPIKEYVESNNLVNKGLYDILRSLFLIDRIKSDEPLFGKFNDEMIQERLYKALINHEQLIKDFNKYKEIYKKIF